MVKETNWVNIFFAILTILIVPLLSFNIVTVGIIITILYNIIVHSLYYFMFNYPLPLSAPSLIGNLIINPVLFIRYAAEISVLLG